MNIYKAEILKQLFQSPFENQRTLAAQLNYSLGMVNRELKALRQENYLDEQNALTEKARHIMGENAPKRAVILAAGFGMRMVPINMETPKALIKVGGEPLIERLIHQLHEVGIREIHVVVGFMKEQFEYLIDDFGVNLVVNKDYAASNNLYSLNLVKARLSNAYILPCDLWCRKNPFSPQEFCSWYMVKNSESCKSEVRVNRKLELVRIPKGEPGNPMVGISYITAADSPALEKRISDLCQTPESQQAFWEEALYEKGRMTVAAKLIDPKDAIEINTYEQLRELDSESEHLKSTAIATACQALHAKPSDIRNITVLKKGMTNRSFLFSCRDQKYIMRIPGEGTEQLINRAEEASVYNQIRGKDLCDDILYINPGNGYKITRFIENARCCDPFCEQDLQKCMAFLKDFHRRKLKVTHRFDIFEKIDFYESLWNGQPSVYRDYQKTKENVRSLQSFIDRHTGEKILTHIDAVPDNFLMYEEDGTEKIRLIDWEYAAMQDPHVDLAMFSIYALYNKEQTDHLIDLYFENRCPQETRIKIYCYVAACGLLWSNWCEYKRNLGVEFGEYSLRQYRYAKDFYRYAREEMKRL